MDKYKFPIRTGTKISSPENVLLIYDSIIQKNYALADIMQVIFPLIQDKEDLIPVGILLRNNKDDKIYIFYDGIMIHPIVYIYTMYSNTEFSDLLLTMLYASNYSYTDFAYISSDLKTVPTVQQWIDKRQLPYTIFSTGPDQILLSLDPLSRNIISVLLDTPNSIMLKNNDDALKNGALAIKAFSNKSLAKCVEYFTSNNDFATPKLLYNESIISFNGNSIRLLLDHGVDTPSYITINSLIMKLQLISNKLSPTVINYLKDGLMACIEYGAYIDDLQLNVIKQFSTDISNEVFQKYSVPYWKKATKSLSGNIPTRITCLLSSLGIYPSNKKHAYDLLTELSKTPITSLKDGAKMRQRIRLVGMVAPISDYASIGLLNPLSNSLLNTDKYKFKSNVTEKDCAEYSDIGVFAYRDASSNLWCITYKDYPQITTTGKNPYNGEVIPSGIAEKNNYFIIPAKYLIFGGLNTIEDIDSLLGNDIINRNISNNAVNWANDYLKSKGFSSNKINSLDIYKISCIYKEYFDNDVIYLINLDHARVTLAWIGYYSTILNAENEFIKNITNCINNQ